MTEGTDSRAGWVCSERLIALVCVLAAAWVLLYRVSYSGAWDGDPSIHARHAMEAVNVFVAEWQAGGNVTKAFMHCYFTFPKMLHEILLTLFVLLANGLNTIDFGDIEFYGAWFSTLFALAGGVTLYCAARELNGRNAALVATLFAVLSAYFLLYANFPRHNMPSHFFAWLFWGLYLRWRIHVPALGLRHAAIIGLIFGAAVPVHYSAAYIVFAPVLAELVLLSIDRHAWRQTALAYVVMGAAALIVPALLEAYFHLYAWLYPEERDWWGYVISRRPYSFIDGMVTTLRNLSSQSMAWKIKYERGFFFGFMLRNFGVVGSSLLALGTLTAMRVAWRERRTASAGQRARLIVLTALVLGVALSLQFFQNARKLAVFYPAWVVLIALGLTQLGAMVPGAGPRLRTPLACVVLMMVVAAQAASFHDEAADVWHARRDMGFMRAYLARQGITEILVFPQWVDGEMAPGQVASTRRKATGRLTVSEAARIPYLVTHRYFPAAHKDALMNCLAGIRPVVSFPNQVALPIFYYEFPLTQEFMDPGNPLTSTRALYRWPEVSAQCLDAFVAQKFLIDDRASANGRD